MERETRLREDLVAQLERAGLVRSPAVAAAMRAVPRHRFLPAESLGDAYADRAIALKVAGDEIVSSISQPSMIAQMLELLDVHPGDRILEIGTGSGYNAALLAELAGPAGSVTSVELDDEMAQRASHVLTELGYGRVRVLGGDGAALDDVPACDRIAVTARCDDIASNWWSALRDDGRMVIPLRFPDAGEFVVGFERGGDRLHGIAAYPCAFIPLRGASASQSPETTQRRSIASIEAVRTGAAHPATLFEIRF